ncbi:MAG: NUDIX hydrolase [Bacteroidales bacterium]
MRQRYLVFLNDRAVLIGQENAICKSDDNGMFINFTDKVALVQAFDRFKLDLNLANLKIKTTQNFAEACNAFNSLFTRIEAAGGIVRNQDGEYLFIKRLGCWDLPKGKLNKNELVPDAALREVTEETGLTGLEITRQLLSTFHIYTDRKGREILKETYWFEMMCKEKQTLVPQQEEDITEARWFSQSELDIPVQNTYASIKDLLEGYFQP